MLFILAEAGILQVVCAHFGETKRLSKLTRKSSFFASPIGFSCHCGMKRVKSLVIKGSAQIACQSKATHLGNAGLRFIPICGNLLNLRSILLLIKCKSQTNRLLRGTEL